MGNGVELFELLACLYFRGGREGGRFIVAPNVCGCNLALILL